MVSKVQRNIIANYIGSLWSAIVGVAFTPMYIDYLGMEAYGLIGVFVALQAWLVLLDMGLSQTLNREMARFHGGSHTAQSIRDLLCSIQLVYIFIAAVIAVVGSIASPWIATNWLRVETLPLGEVTQALAVSVFVIAFRWISGLYRSAIMGLQEQLWINVSNAVFATLRGFGVIVVLAWVSPTIKAFFVYQGILAAIEAINLWWMMDTLLPCAPNKGQFQWVALQKVRRFAGGVMGITLLSLLLTQVDKVMLSKILPLSEFGFYALAGVIAGTIYMIIGPVSSATAPRLAELVAQNKDLEIRRAYHRFSQLLTLVSVPMGLVVSFFADHLLLLWTRNVETTEAVVPIVSVLIIGTLLNGLMYTPYTLQLAYGWTRFATIVNLISVAILLPAVYWASSTFGAVGAAWVWVLLNIGYIVIGLPFMHRRLLRGELRNWYLQDVVPAFLAVSIVIVIGKIFVPKADINTPLLSILCLSGIGIVAFLATALVLPIGRELVLGCKKLIYRTI